MRFLKKSLSALFAFLFLLLASSLVTSTAHAQEASDQEVCLLTDKLLIKKGCKIKENNRLLEFLPSQLLTPVKLQKEEKKQETHEVFAQTYIPEVHNNIPTTTPTPESDLSADVLFSMINEHRTKIGKPSLEKEAQVCSAAEARREGIRAEIFNGQALHSGFYAMNLPYQSTENMIWQNSETEAFNWWLNSPVHRSAIEGDYKYACGVCNGKVCNMIFANYNIETSNNSMISAQTVPPKAL